MKIQHPLLWVTLLFILGILWGHAMPCLLYLYLLAATLVGITALTLTKRPPELLTILFWFLLGCCRSTAITQENTSEHQHSLFTNIQELARHRNEQLVLRLHDAGLNGSELQVCSALLLGNKDTLQRDTRSRYSEVGASHLLALSGMHLGILYAMFYILFVSWMRHTRWRWYMLPPILLCIWGYALVAGMPNSLCRAAIMLSATLIITISQHDTQSLQPLAISAILILFAQPDALYDIGFQLSFLAVFFIVSLYIPLTQHLEVRNPILSMLLVSLIAQWGTAPLTVYYFHTLPLLSSLFCIILIPLTTLIIYAGIACLVIPISTATDILAFLIRMQDTMISFFSRIPCSTLHNLHTTPMQVILIYTLMLLAIFRYSYNGKEKRRFFNQMRSLKASDDRQSKRNFCE